MIHFLALISRKPENIAVITIFQLSVLLYRHARPHEAPISMHDTKEHTPASHIISAAASPPHYIYARAAFIIFGRRITRNTPLMPSTTPRLAPPPRARSAAGFTSATPLRDESKMPPGRAVDK